MPNPPPKKSGKKKLLSITILIVIICAGLFLYLRASFLNLQVIVTSPQSVAAPIPQIGVQLNSQNLLGYNFNNSVVPYVLVNYRSANVITINANATILKSYPPSKIYILNTSIECFNCGSVIKTIQGSIVSSLLKYNLIRNQSDISTIQVSSLSSIQGNSILIMLNGLMPIEMFNRVGSSNQILLQYLMQKGTSIVYVGQNFTNILTPYNGITTPQSQLPDFLSTTYPYPNASSYYFNNPTFSFSHGRNYGSMTYINSGNGSIVAFSNFPTSWPPDQVGRDIALAIRQLFWLPSYTNGYRVVPVSNATAASGRVGIFLTNPMIPFAKAQASALNDGVIRIVVAASTAFGNSTNTTFRYIITKPALPQINGTMSLPQFILPGDTLLVPINIFANVSRPQPNLVFYDANMTRVLSLPLPQQSVSQFKIRQQFNLPPGNYLAVLYNFTNVQSAAAFFNIYPIDISLASADFNAGSYVFYVTSNGNPINGTSYKISVNGLYPTNGTIINGVISYSLPTGATALSGQITFGINIFSHTFTYATSNTPPLISVNKQYIELAIVTIVVLLLVFLVRAPSRDEFYIDVPMLPERQKQEIRLKPKDLIGVFDKLNMSYHWRYMPLSRSEFRMAITNNIRYNNIPVGLTYSNVEHMLNELTGGGFLVTSDNLYAPKEWITASSHDIEYLATFKKLRLFLVTHAYVFTDLDTSTVADIVATFRGERKYIAIYSKTSKFKDIPIYTNARTYIAFLNSYRLEEFKAKLYESTTTESEELKMYISVGYVKLVDADNPVELLG